MHFSNIPFLSGSSSNAVRKWGPLLLFCFAAIVACYWIYLNNQHFSTDTFNAILDVRSMAETNLRNGRIIHFLLYSGLGLLDFNIIAHQRITQFILAATTALCAILISKKLSSTFEEESFLSSGVTCVLVLFLFINPAYQTGWFYWPETALGASVSLAACTTSIMLWCHDGKNRLRLLTCFLFLLITLEMYQVYVEIYLGVCIAYSVSRHNFEPTNKLLKEIILLFAFAAITSFISIIAMKLVQLAGLTTVDERSASISLPVIFENIKSLLSLQGSIASDLNFFMGGIPLATFAILFLPLLLKRTAGRRTLVCLGCLILCYLISFAPLVISGKYWPASRTYIGIYCTVVIAGLFLVKAFSENREALSFLFAGLVSILVICSSHLLDAQSSTLLSNQEDNKEIQSICLDIQGHEDRTGVKITNLVYFYDEEKAYFYPDVKYGIYDNNVRGMAYDWCFEGMMRYWGEYRGNISAGAESDGRLMFGCVNWNSQDLSQQIIYDGETAYLCIY